MYKDALFCIELVSVECNIRSSHCHIASEELFHQGSLVVKVNKEQELV